MRKIIFLIIVALFSGIVHAQLSPLENYIYTKTYLDYNGSNQATKISETVEYFDGFGRPKQIINIKGSPETKDVVTKITYDQFGRQTLDYLPVPQSTTQNGAIYDNPLANAPNTPYGSEKIYAEKILEKSPLDRVLEQRSVGTEWSTKPIKYDYNVNADGEVKRYIATFNYDTSQSSLVFSTGYQIHQLYKNTVTDEDGNKTIEFKNGQEQIVLVRKMINSSISSDTYYVYNNYDQLAYILTPEAVDQIKNLNPGDSVPDTILNSLCYQYKYDVKNRLVEKRLPGKGKESMVYDKSDRLIMTQDANLNSQGKWIISKYDQYGRVIYTGVIAGGSRESMQAQAAGLVVKENRDTTGFSKSGIQIYYTNNLFYEIEAVLSVNYYDSYPMDTPAFTPTIPNQNALLTDNVNSNVNTRGLLLASYIKNLENDNWTKKYTYFDTKGKIIGTHSINNLGGYTTVENKLDFIGIPQQTITRHKRLVSENEKVIVENFTYDSQNRLLKHTHKVGNNPQEEILVQKEYNELSQIKTKKIGGTDVLFPLQTIDYQYNIRGLLAKINDPVNLGTKLFGYEIRYGNPLNTSNATARYNGNISEVDWKTSKDGTLKRYSYQYDGLNRLLSGIYSEPFSTVPPNDAYNETLSYDLNGNIKTLKRNMFQQYVGVVQMDDLRYDYNGNQLTNIYEDTPNYLGYPESAGNLIHYDLNGNMKDHEDKGILAISYNHLNLPNYVKFNEFVTREDPFFGGLSTVYKNTTYIYRSDGVKQSKVHTYFAGKNQSEVSFITDYLDGFQYNFERSGFVLDPILSDGLQFVPTAEGYYDFIKNKYIYQYKDQLGNIRLSFYKDALGNAVIDKTNDYYPFGLEFGGNVSTNTSTSFSPNYTYTFQGQEKQQETGWNSFKWRNYDPSIGRFINVDVLAEDYEYQSPYAFSENKVINHVELEGLEGIAVGPGGLPIPLPPPTYGNSKTGFHPAGKVSPDWLDRGVENLKRKIAEPPQWGIALTTYILFQAKSLSDRVLNNDKEEKGDKNAKADNSKKGNEAKSSKTEKSEKGVIYKVPGKATKSGKPYVGKTKKGDPNKRGGKDDGRDRSKAEVIDEYDPKNAEEGSFKEQKAMDKNGGLDKLDNKRKEMSTERFKEAETKYENKGN